MKRTRILFFIAIAFAFNETFAQTTENFNKRPEANLSQIKSYLQSHCWQFHDFEINNSWDPAMEGDGAMVSGSSSTSSQNTGILSPLLSMNGQIHVSFKYKFSAMVIEQRWLKIYSTDGNNNIISILDSINFKGDNNNSIYTYDKVLSNVAGQYKIYINYQGTSGDNRIAIDQLNLGAPTVYNGGCNQAPIAGNDFIGGTDARTATGNVLSNDHDPENNILTAHLITNSEDGNVELQPSGAFTFTPKPGFNGKTTTFTYTVCDNGTPSLCSDIATATIVFQASGALPVTIVDLAADYSANKVNLKWTTTFEMNNDHFDVEHSTDGEHFTTAGSIKGHINSTAKNNYEFNDEISKNTLNKNDMYYRLKQVDLDGKSSYTKILVVRVYRTKALQSLSVTPNPEVNDIKVNVQLNENSFVVMKISDGNGTEEIRKTTRASSGINSFNLDGTSHLQAGMYLLEVIVNSNERMTVKLIKN